MIDAMSFNPRSPCGERRRRPWQSRLGAPRFNPRSPCGERPGAYDTETTTLGVSTHAPLAGSDYQSQAHDSSHVMFQPTLPLRGATQTNTPLRQSQGFQPTLPLRGATTLDAL